MSGFSAQWLALREGADAKARSDAAVHALNCWLGATAHVNIIDLGCGSASNLRWLAPRIAAAQCWHLLDNDRQLLARAASVLRDWADAGTPRPEGSADGKDNAATLRLSDRLSAHLRHFDLSARLPPLDDAHLIGASALLDLVSADWLHALVRDCARRRIGMLFALNYDGRVRFAPAHVNDALIRDAVNRDQYSDKGFGPALGPGCGAALSSACATRGYRVTQWRSDWQLGAADQAMHARLVDDFAHIAERRLPAHQQHRIAPWHRWRHEVIGRASLQVGHVDILALPRAAVDSRPTPPSPGL